MQSTQNIDLDKLYSGKSEKKDTISNQEETSKTPINLDSLYNPHKEPTSLETEQSKYDVGYVLPETNTLEALNEHRAQRQSALDKVANGTVKMLGTAVQSTVEPFTNLTLGLGMALAKGELNPIYDNPASRGLDSMNKFLQEKFPNYYSKAEQDYNLAQELKTVNFWADKVGNGVGFMAGAIASGLASGAVSAKLFNSISKLAIGESLGQTFSAGEKAINVLEDLNKTSKLVRLSDNATQAISGLTGAIGESGMEARQIKDQTIKALKDQRDKGLNNLSDKDIEDQADAAGNIGFGFNMAIVGGSNIIQFGKLFTGAANNEIKTFNKISRQSGKFIVEEPTSGLVKTLESPITEATQEQLQQAIQSGVTNYYERKNDKDAKDSVDNLIQATIYGLEQAYGTKSGWEQALIGGLLGGAGHLATMSKENKIEVQKQANTQALVDQLNNYKLSDSFKPLYEAAVRHTSFENTKQIALKNNDIFAYQNAHTGQFFSYIQSRIDANKFESVLEDLNQVKNLSEDQFKKDFGFDENTPLPKPVHQFVNDLILKAKEVNRLSESIDNKFPNLHPDLKQQLKFTAYSISDIDNREASLSSKLAVLTKGKIAYDAERFADKTNYKETLGKKLDEVKINPADKQEIETILEDLGKLLGRREGFIEAYNKLSDPKFQKDEQERIEKKAKEVTESIDLTPTVESVADKIKKGETEFTPEELQLQQNESEALEKELKKPTISDIEAKKADIERRRKEELSGKPTPEELSKIQQTYENNIKELEEFKKYGNTIEEVFDNLHDEVINTNPVPKLRSQGLSDEQIDKHPEFIEWKRKSDLIDRINDYYSPRTIMNDGRTKTIDDFITEEKDSIKELPNKKKRLGKSNIDSINAKYDAELESTTHSISNIESKKADIERRRLKSINEVEEVLFNNGSVWHGHYYTGRLSDRGRPLAERTSKFTKEEVIKELNTKYDAELTALGEENVANIAQDGDNESSKNPLASQNEQKSLATTHIEEDPNIINTQSRLEDNRDQSGKKKITYSTIEAGPDDGSDESADRYYRFVNNNNPKDFKGLLVTQKNNEELFNEILKLDSRAKKFVEKTPEYEGIWMVITKDGKPVKENDKLVFGTLTKVEAIENNRILYKTDEERDKAIQDLTEFRRSILDATEDSYVNFTDKSKGHAQFEKTVNGLRQSHSVIGRLANSLNEVSLELPVVGVNGSTTAFLSNGQIANTGKLYARNKEGNIVDLIPRFLSEEEQNKVFHLVLQKVGAEERKSNNISEQLGKLIYFGLKKGQAPTDYTLSQVWSPAGYEKSTIFIGKERVNKNILSTEEGQTKLREFLKNKRVNVNSKYGFEDRFTDIFGKEHDSYKDYLITGENPLFGTDLVKNTEVQFRNQYFTYDPTIKEKEIKETTKSEKIKFQKKTPKDLDRLKVLEINNNPLSKEEQDWFKSNFPNIPIEVVKGLIENKSFGRFLSAGKILLSDEATFGTLYHEAFHVISQMYLSQKELSALYKETKEKTGAKTDLEAEEELAEEFIEYKKSGKVIGGRYQRNDLFRKILNFIKDLLRIPVNSIEDIYRRIDKGYYKNKPNIQSTQFKSLDRSKISEDKGVIFENEVLSNIGALYYDELFKGNKTPNEITTNISNILADRIFNKIVDQYEAEQDLGKSANLQYILENWNEIIETFRLKSKANDIEIKIVPDDEYKEEENSIIEEENKTSNDTAYQEANLVSTKATMNDSVWTLITSLKQKNKDGSDKISELTGLPLSINPTQTYNFLLKQLAGLSTFEDIYNKIDKLADTRPELIDLLEKLGQPSSSNSYAQQLFQNQFRQDFGKNRMTSHKTILKEDGTVYVVDANNENNAGRILEKWQNNLLSTTPTTKEGKIILDLDKVQFGNSEVFLQSIGLKLSPETIQQSKEEDKFIPAVTAIQNYLRKNKGDITTLFAPTKEEKEAKTDVKGNIQYLTQLEADFNPDSAELSFNSTENKTVYSVGYNNALSIVKNDINNAKTWSELIAKRPHLATISTEGSVYLAELFDANGNKRKDRKLEINLHDGLSTDSENTTDSFKASTRKLTAGDKWVQEINSILLDGRSSYIRASDKSSEHTIYMNKYGKGQKLYIPIEDLKSLNNPKLLKTFQGYFKSELKRVALHKVLNFGNDLDVFDKQGGKFSVFEDILSGETKKAINEYIETLKQQDLSQEQLLEEIDKSAANFEKQVHNDTEVFFVKYSEQIRNELKELKITKSQGISKDFEKYSLEQLTNTIAVNDFINSIEQTKLFTGDMVFYKDLFKRTSAFTGAKQTAANSASVNNWLNNNFKRLDGKLENGEIHSVVFEDVTQSLQSELLDSYINTLVESGMSQEQAQTILDPYTKMDEGDAQGWITLDEYRSFWTRLGKEIPQAIFEKAQKGKILNANEMHYFTVIKAQYAGPQKYNTIFAPAYHKYSLLPILPSMIKGKNLDTLLDTMSKNQIGYALFKSGSKVGTRVTNGKANKFYTDTNSGTINTENWQKQTVFYDFLGLQTETSEPHNTVIFGTQFRKLLFSNQFESGNEVIKGSKELLDKYNSIIDNLVQKEKSKLIDELGINPETYKSEDVSKIVNLLQEEAKNRNLADNLIDGLQSEIVEGKLLLKYKFDAMVTKNKIDSMLMSLVNSRLIRQKITGDALIQVSSSGFENKGNRKVGYNSVLQSYRKDSETGKTLAAEVMIPLDLKVYGHLLEKYGTLEDINSAIKDGKIDKKDLQLVGYRIPTQGFNSMEFFEIAEFLPTESSTSIVVPTTIVAKSGSDFDVDKLNIIKRSDKSSELMDIAIDILSHPDNFVALITPNSSSIIKNVANEIRFIEHLNDRPDPDLIRDKFESQEAYEKAYNEKKDTYIAAREQGLKNNIRYTNQLKLSGKEGKIAQFIKFMTAKDMIGIGAIQNTHNILAQTHNLTIDGNQAKINLPHNKDGEDILLAKQKDVENRHQISEIISQVLTASVDAAKDPFMFDINLTMETLGTALYLVRIGVPFETVGYFLAQPIITDYLKELSINKSGFLKATNNSEFKNKLIGKVKDNYGKLPQDYQKITFSESKLKDNLSKLGQTSNKDFNTEQLQLLDDYLAYQEQSQLLSDAIRATNMDTSGVGKNLNTIQAKLDLIEKVKKDGFVKGIEKILDNSIVKIFNQLEFTQKAYSQFYYTQTEEFKKVKQDLLKEIDPFGDSAKDKLATLIENDLINFIVQNFGYPNITELRSKLFRTEPIAKKLLDLKNKKDKNTDEQKIADNLLIKELQPLLATKKKDDNNIRMYTKRLDTFTSNQLTEAFRDLKELDPNLAKEIMDLGILQSGLNNSPITYLGIIPFEYYNDLVKKAFESYEAKKNGAELEQFKSLFLDNNGYYYDSKGNLKQGKPKLGSGMYGKNYSLKSIEKENKSINNSKQFQKLTEEEKAKTIEQVTKEHRSIAALKDLSAKSAYRIGGEVKFENDPNADWKGYNQGITSVLNEAYMTPDTPFHEILAHPIIRAIKIRSEIDNSVLLGNVENFTSLYDSLLKELETGRGKEVFEQVKRDYITKNPNQFELDDNWENQGEAYGLENKPSIEEINRRKEKAKYTLEEQEEEAIVTLLGLMAADKLDAIKDATLISKLKELWKQISDFVKSLLKQDGIKIDELPITTTLNDLAEIMAYGNNKIILPGYKVEYSTPLGNKYDTLEEVNNEIKGLADVNVEVDLNNIELKDKVVKNVKDIPVNSFYYKSYGVNFTKDEDGWMIDDSKYATNEEVLEAWNNRNTTIMIDPFDDENIIVDEDNINSFIEKNKEYEQSKEIIEQWKKENNIQYDPEEVYSRGQGFYSSIGAYSNLELDLLLKNLIQHIQDNKKAGGEFTISAFTKPIDKRLKHIEGTGDRIRFVIYPKSNHIKWAAPTDVYSGSVWDAHEKVSKDKKSELLGVSFTKAPALRNINQVSPNLADIIDNLSHAHNELGIELTTNNFRIEYDDNIDYSTKKLIDNINKILDGKYGKLNKPEINKPKDKIQQVTAESFEEVQELKKQGWIEVGKSEEGFPLFQRENTNILIKQPTQTRENTTSIQSVQSKVIPNDLYGIISGDITTKIFKSNIDTEINASINNNGNIKFFKIKESSDFHSLDEYIEIIPSKEIKEELENEIIEFQQKQQQLKKEYTSQALTNLKVTALKEVARKYPRSLITTKVVPINPNMVDGSEIQFQLKTNEKPRINEELRKSVISKFHNTKEQAETALREIKDLLLGSYVHPVGDKWKVYAPVQKERSNQFPQQFPNESELLENPPVLEEITSKFTEGKTNPITTDILNSIINDSDQSWKEGAELAKYLLSLQDKNKTVTVEIVPEFSDDFLTSKGLQNHISENSTINGFWEPNENKLYLSQDTVNAKNQNNFKKVFLHELVHSYTGYPFAKANKGLELSQEERTFIDDITKIYNTAKETSSNKNMYGFTNPSEFISEIMSNPNFIKEIKSLKLSLWQRIIDTIVKFFNGKSIYNKSILLITDYLDNLDKVNPSRNLKFESRPSKSLKSSKTEEEKKQFKESAFKEQHIFFQRRINELKKQQKEYKEGTPQYNKIQEEIDTIEPKLTQASVEQNEQIYLDLGNQTLDKIDTYIDRLSKGEALTDKNIEFVADVIEAFRDFPELETRTAKLERELAPIIQDYTRKIVQEHATEKEPITQEKIDAQTEDIGKFQKGVGSLSDLTNYIGRTVGSVIKTTQNKVSTRNKKITSDIQTEVDSLENWGKKNGVPLDRVYNIFIQPHKGSTRLTQQYYESGNENPNWKRIQNTPELKRFYDFYQETIEKAQENLPIQLGRNFIPNIRKSTLKNKLKSLVPVHTFEEGQFVGNEDLFADVLQTEYVKKLSEEEKSRDLGASLLQFAAYANNYEEMSAIIPTVRILQRALTTKINSKGQVIDRTFTKSSDPTKEVKGQDSNVYKMVEDYINMQVFGSMKFAEGKIKIGNLYNEEGKPIGEKYILGSDIADVALKYNSLLRIGFSPVTAISNWLFGDVTNIIEAVGGRFFTSSGLIQASNIFMSQNFKKDSVLNKLLEELNPLQELDDYDQINKVSLKGRMSAEKLQEYAYSMQKLGEKWLQSRTMLAVMIKDGYLTSSGELTEKYNKASEQEKQQLTDKVQRLNQMIHGRYTTRESATLSQSVLYRLASQFKKWIPSYIESHFDKLHYDNRLQAQIEGRFRTLGRLAIDLKDTINRIKEGKLTESEIYNLKKNAIEITLMAATALLFAGLHGDDDKNRKKRQQWAVKTGLTLLNRVSGDISFFYSPSQLAHTVKNVVPLVTTLDDLRLAISYIPQAFDYKKGIYQSGSHKGQSKVLTKLANITPGFKPLSDIRRLSNKFELEELR